MAAKKHTFALDLIQHPQGQWPVAVPPALPVPSADTRALHMSVLAPVPTSSTLCSFN